MPLISYLKRLILIAASHGTPGEAGCQDGGRNPSITFTFQPKRILNADLPSVARYAPLRAEHFNLDKLLHAPSNLVFNVV